MFTESVLMFLAVELLGEEALRLQLVKPNCIKATDLVGSDD